jgi:catechol 2,3-dioxygenase-like lactoylglutathione lyase family enzyme
MLDHVSIAVVDIARATRFYDSVMAALGVARIGEDEGWAGYGLRCDADNPDRSYLSLRRSGRGRAVHAVHYAFKAPSRSAVDSFWRDGLAAGGTDDGPPGLRAHYHPRYYAAFLIDPDGNRIEAVCHTA